MKEKTIFLVWVRASKRHFAKFPCFHTICDSFPLCVYVSPHSAPTKSQQIRILLRENLRDIVSNLGYYLQCNLSKSFLMISESQFPKIQRLRSLSYRGAWMAQLVKRRLTLDFSSGHELPFCEISLASGSALTAQSMLGILSSTFPFPFSISKMHKLEIEK